MKTAQIILIVMFGLASCDNKEKNKGTQIDQTNSTQNKYAQELLDFVLTDSSNQNQKIYTNITQINDREMAIKAVDPILFDGYGKENIIEQKPYKVSKIDNYWIIEGTQKDPHIGGVFHLVLDSKKGTIIYLIHGK